MLPRTFCADAPDFTGRVICNEQRTIGPDRDPDGPAVYLFSFFVGGESGEKIFHGAGRPAVYKRDKSYFVPDQIRSVPCAVSADEIASVIIVRCRAAAV